MPAFRQSIGLALIAASMAAPATAGDALTLFVPPDAVLTLAPPLRFGPLGSPTALLDVATATPALCASFAVSGTALRLLDSNLQLQQLAGIAAVRYGPALDTVRVLPVSATHGPLLQCRSIPAPGLGSAGDADRLLRSGFESVADTSLQALGLDGQAIAHVEHAPGGQATWRIRLINRGEVATGTLRVREYLPQPDGLHPPAVSAIACQLDGQPCTTDAAGRARLELGPLAPGASRLIELTRAVASGEVGASALAAVAVFSDPATTPERSAAGGIVAVELRVTDAGKARAW